MVSSTCLTPTTKWSICETIQLNNKDVFKIDSNLERIFSTWLSVHSDTSLAYLTNFHVETSLCLRIKQFNRLKFVTFGWFVVASDSGEALLNCTLAAEAAHDEEVDSVSVLPFCCCQAVVNPTHQLLIGDYETSPFHVPDKSQIFTIHFHFQVISLCCFPNCFNIFNRIVAPDELGI